MTSTLYLLECVKTGRHWPPHPSEAMATRAARQLGLKDFTITPVTSREPQKDAAA